MTEALSDQAIDWVVRLGSGRATDADRAAYADWCGLSPAHAAAAGEAEAIIDAVGSTRNAAAFRNSAVVLPHPGTTQMRARLTRRALIGGAIAATVAGVVGSSGVLGPVARLYADYSTGVGERRRVALSDGSTAWLNTASALSVGYTDQIRHVRLDAGEAVFQVAKDATRPFVVAAAGGEAQAIGTVFTVRRATSATEVAVAEGVVEVRYGAQTPVRLESGYETSYGADGIAKPTSTDVSALTAWQRGKLIFNRRPLGEVMGELERYRVGRIFVADERLAALQITGVFDLDDPDQLLRTVVEKTGARIDRYPLLTVLR